MCSLLAFATSKAMTALSAVLCFSCRALLFWPDLMKCQLYLDTIPDLVETPLLSAVEQAVYFENLCMDATQRILNRG